MNKFIKLGKRILALFIVVLLNVNTYAAVGANDGSAFVTKAEFDALVNTFNEQMDSYQSGLNSKIDGAIANYLAGLSAVQTIPQSSLLNSFHYKFTNNWNVWEDDKECELGDKFIYSIYLYAMMAQSWTSGGRLAEWSAYTGSQGSEVTMGSKTSKYLLINKSSYNDSYYTLAGRMESTMKSTWSGGYTWGGLTDTTSTPGQYNPQVGYDSDNSDYFNTASLPISGTIFGVNINVSSSFANSNDDVIETDISEVNELSGSTVNTGTKLYGVITTEINKKKLSGYKTSNGATGGWCKCKENNNSKHNGANTNASNYKVRGYYHDYREIGADQGYTDLILDDVSTAVNDLVGYYNGLPLFTASADGRAKLTFKMTGAEGYTNLFEIQKGKFGNSMITGGLTGLNGEYKYTDDVGNVIKNVPTIPAGKLVTVEFDAKTNETYWIKVYPNGSESVEVKTESIIIEQE